MPHSDRLGRFEWLHPIHDELSRPMQTELTAERVITVRYHLLSNSFRAACPRRADSGWPGLACTSALELAHRIRRRGSHAWLIGHQVPHPTSRQPRSDLEAGLEPAPARSEPGALPLSYSMQQSGS